MFQVCILLCYRLVTFKFCLHNLYELIASAMPVVYNNTFGSNIHTKQQYANVAYNKAPNATQFALFTQFHIVLSRTKFVFSKLEVVCQLLSLLSASSTAAFCYVTFLLIPANWWATTALPAGFCTPLLYVGLVLRAVALVRRAPLVTNTISNSEILIWSQ